MKIKVSSIAGNEKWLQRVKDGSLKKLAEYKSRGYTKEQCYQKFSKVFVDKNY